MKIWERFFGKHKEAHTPEPIEPEEEIIAPTPYDYGLDGMKIFLCSRDYGWSDPDESHKKVILTNPQECRDKISFMGMVSAWRGTGHGEWEALLGGWFVEAVVAALESNSEEADITHLFNRDFLACNNRVFTQQQVYNHLIKWFDKVEDTEDTLKLRIHI